MTNTTVEEDKLIIIMVKSIEHLYKKKARKTSETKEAFEEMAEFMSIKLKSTLSADDIKKRWECMRKTFVTACRQGRSNCAYYNDLQFLKSHIKQYPEAKSNNAVEEKQTENENISSDFQGVLKVNVSDNQILQKNTIKSTNIFDKYLLTNAVSPPIDKSAKRKIDELDEVEKNIIDIAERTTQSIIKLQEEDCYEMAIKESLRLVNKDELLSCVTGILSILLQYQKKT